MNESIHEAAQKQEQAQKMVDIIQNYLSNADFPLRTRGQNNSMESLLRNAGVTIKKP